MHHVHLTYESGGIEELTPPHPPREDTPEYRAAHHHLVDELDSACTVCGVRQSTLHDPVQNPFGAKAMETHHYPIERSLVDACDPARVAARFPGAGIVDAASLLRFADSEANLLVLCDQCHRSKQRGIHHLLVQEWAVLPFLKDGYILVAESGQEAAEEAADESLIECADPSTTGR